MATLHPPPVVGKGGTTSWWIQHCVELPGQARGWVQEVFPMHNTVAYSMCLAGASVRQQGTVEGHGQAIREQT